MAPALKSRITEPIVNNVVLVSARMTISPPGAVVCKVPPLKLPPTPEERRPFTLRTLAAAMVKLLAASLTVLTAAVVCPVMAPEMVTFLVASSIPRVAPVAIAAGAFTSVP